MYAVRGGALTIKAIPGIRSRPHFLFHQSRALFIHFYHQPDTFSDFGRQTEAAPSGAALLRVIQRRQS